MDRKSFSGYVSAILIFLVLFVSAAISFASAPAGYSEYYFPGDENLLADIWSSLRGRSVTAPRHSVITVVAWSNNTTVYYDHWENGYNFNPNDPSTADQTVVLLNKGDSYTFESANIPVNPQVTTPVQYDGRDRIYVAGGTVSVTRESWEEALGNVFTVAWEVYPVKPQMTTYILPFGEDLGYRSFVRVYALLQATQDNTVVQIDFDQDGTYDTFCTDKTRATCTPGTSVTLNRGEVFLLDNTAVSPQAAPYNVVHTGTLIRASSTLQVNYIAGHNTDNYQARGFSAFPRGFWDTEYYSPVDSSNGTGTGVYPANTNFPTNIYIYNPNATTLTINYQTSTGSGSFTVPANSTRSFYSQTGNYVPQGSGVYLKGDDVFWGVTIIDDGGPTHESGHTLIPAFLMSNEQYIGWAPSGTTPSAANANDAGIFITPAQDNTVVFVDRNNDGTVDYTYTLNRMQTQYVYDATDGDMSNSHIWATGPITLAYGQNTASSPTAAPAIDVGYGILPGGDWIDKVLTVSKTADPVVLPTAVGSQSTFTLTANSYYYAVDGISVVDTLPANWQFVNNSATITLADMTTISGAAANPTISGGGLILTWPNSLLSSMSPNQQITITFTGQTTAAFAVGAITRNITEATGTRTVGGLTQTFTTSDFAFNTYGDIAATKTSSATDPLYPGDQFTYTVTATNPTAAALTGVSLYDSLPAGVSYVAASGSLTCDQALNIRDEFAAVAYTNNGPNNNANWAGAWTETDSLGGGAASGLAQITGGVLRLGLAENYLDQFGTVAYTNTNGTRDWSASAWTETNDAQDQTTGDAAGGVVRITGGVLQLRNYRSVADTFATNVYTRNDGTTDWAGAWTESDAGGAGAGTGYIQVTGGQLRINNDSGVATQSVSRGIDLTGTGATTATFTFGYTTSGNLGNADVINVQYRTGGSGGWTTFAGGTYTNDVTGSASFNIPLASPANLTEIRFAITSTTAYTDNNEFFYVDNATITYNANLPGIQRMADLSGATSATLSFNLTNMANLEAGDTFVVEASGNGGSSWGILETFTSASALGAKSYNIKSPTDYTAANTVIRFRITGGFDQTNETFSIDDINILYQRTPTEIQRMADLSGATSATLSFNLTNMANLEAGDTFVVEASGNGGSSWGMLETFTSASALGAKSYNIKSPTDYTAANTVIRFRITGGFDQTNETVSIDNVNISFFVSNRTFAAADPPEFLSSGTGCTIQPGGSLTLTYNVTVDKPLATGVEQITNTASINSNEIILPLNASATNTVVNPSSESAAIISSYVWLDADGDGVKEVGEPGLANVEVTLKDEFGTPIATTTTDGTGRYVFAGITPGNDYYVEATSATLPAGLTQSGPAGHSDNRTDAFDLAAGQSYTAANLGYEPAAGTAAFGDLVWSDADGDGIRDFGEPGLAGVVVQLWEDVNTDGAIDGSDTLAGSSTTAAGGGYLIKGVAADGTKDYIVYIDGTQAVLTGFSQTNGYGPAVNVPANSVFTNFDIGFQNNTGTYTIKDRVWNDLNEDNQDDGESGIAGVTVDLLDASRNVIATAITDASGYFTFNGVIGAGADYTLLVTDTSNVLTNYYGITNEAKAGEVAISNVSANLDYTVEPTEPHFGYGLNRSIGGTVFNDLNGISGKEAGEPGISGITVQLYNDVNLNDLLDAGDTLRSTLVSDGNGDYLFSGLPDGKYIVSIPTPPAAYTYTTESPDNDPAVGSQQPATIAAGGTVLNLNFGYQATTPRSISGTVWNDADSNGVVGAGETRFQNVTIEVLDGATIIETVSTDVNGNYTFSGLTTKTYTVRITDALGLLAGYTGVYENDGVLDGQQASLDLTGSSASNIRFGFALPGVTLVTLSSFRAYEDNGQMRIEWSTSFQRNTAGFYLLRRNEGADTYTQISRHILPALLSSPQGGTYSLIDNGTSLKKSNTYVLVEIEDKGKKIEYGPFTIPAGGGNAIQGSAISGPTGAAPLLRGKAGRSLKPAALQLQRFTDSEGTVVITQSGASDDQPANSVSHQSSGYTTRPREISAQRVTRLMATKVAQYTSKGLKKLKNGAMAKIAVDREGLYYIDAGEISILLGIPQNSVKGLIKKGKLAMKSQGKEVAYISAKNNTGIFFYGQGMDSVYARENIYWLYQDKGLRVKSVKGRGPSPVGYSSFTEIVHAEKDTTFLNTDIQDPATDYWFWSYLFVAPDYTDFASDAFTIRTDGVADISATATLAVHLKGFTDTDADPDHHIRVRLNGAVIGEGWLEGTNAEPPVVIQFDQTLLNSGDNVIGVEAVLDPGVPYSAFYIDSFDISYQRVHEAAENALTFRSEDTGSLTVYGFTDPSIIVFDITNPERPLLELATTILDEGGSFSVSFVVPSVGIRYLVTTPTAAATEIDAWADTPSELTSKLNAADYVIIAPDQLKNAVKPLADYRQGQGYQTMVVNLEDIMDEFNYGISSPRAIHDFLAYAYYNWKKAPRYVVLAGEGTYDYKDNMGFGDNLVPTMVVSTPTGLFSSDNYFVDADGDHLPDMAIGRLPVLTAEELQDLLSKIISFENTTGNHVMMLTDNPDRDGNYPSDSNDIAQLVPSKVSVEKMYLPAYSGGAIRNALLYGIPTGTFLVNYIGHGNTYTLADEGLLSIPDVDYMENAGRLFVLSAMSCAVGEFAFPGYDSLSEALVMKKDGGAVAVFAPSGLSLNALSKTLDEGFFSAAFGGGTLTLGDSLREAFKYYKNSGGADFMLDIYNLLGDPALRLKIR